jgi:hypothetical protein
MLTIINLINYFTGSYVNNIVLILVTIVIYYFIISKYWNSIENNIAYIVILIMLLMIDIVTIYLIFSEPHKFDFNKIIKKNKVKKVKNKNKKNLESKKILIEKKENNSIEVYDENKSVSLNTYKNINE